MIQDISPRIFHNEYYRYRPKKGDEVYIFRGNEVFASTENGLVFPKVEMFSKNEIESLLYLFCIDDVSAFLLIKEGYEPDIEGFGFVNIHDIRKLGVDMFSLFTAKHLYVWYRDNKYCGRCGNLMEVGNKERNLICSCGNMVFPKIMPAVIVGVRKGDSLLMTRYKGRPYAGWALIAGFCEIGESAEETVKREVMEETGIKVKNVTYYASQPWGVDQDLLLGFYCDAATEDNIKMDNEELSVAEWIKREDIPERKDLESLTATMMEAFRRGIDKEIYKKIF